MRFTLLKMGTAWIYARLNVNVFYINFIYIFKSVTCVTSEFYKFLSVKQKPWIGAPAAAWIRSNSLSRGPENALMESKYPIGETSPIAKPLWLRMSAAFSLPSVSLASYAALTGPTLLLSVVMNRIASPLTLPLRMQDLQSGLCHIQSQKLHQLLCGPDWF